MQPLPPRHEGTTEPRVSTQPRPYASVEFRAAYEQAAQHQRPVRTTAAPGTISWLIENYLDSPNFRDLAPASRNSQRRQFDWLRQVAGDLPFARMEVRHVEALMGKKHGAAAANTVKKRLSSLFVYAARLGMMQTNPARFARSRKLQSDGYATWTAAEIAAFRTTHPTGTKARLALELVLNTGAARQDLAGLGWQNATGGRIQYRRHKTGVAADLPILPELAVELAHVPRDRLVFLSTSAGRPHTPAGLSNWFRTMCLAAGLHDVSIHGLRKAGATRLAEAGATEHEVMAFLAHASPREGATYTRAAQRRTLADSGLARLSGVKGEQNLSNPADRLDNEATKAVERKGKNA